MRWTVITNCDTVYYKLRQVLQSAMDLLQIVTGITKCDDYYKLRQYRCKMSVQADRNSRKGRAKHKNTSLLNSTKHVRSPDWPGNHHLHTADKKREMPRNTMTL